MGLTRNLSEAPSQRDLSLWTSVSVCTPPSVSKNPAEWLSQDPRPHYLIKLPILRVWCLPGLARLWQEPCRVLGTPPPVSPTQGGCPAPGWGAPLPVLPSERGPVLRSRLPALQSFWTKPVLAHSPLCSCFFSDRQRRERGSPRGHSGQLPYGGPRAEAASPEGPGRFQQQGSVHRESSEVRLEVRQGELSTALQST